MPSKASVPLVLIDPVCNMLIAATSPHHHAHGGAMFYFCSEVCCTRFSADPLNFVNVRTTPHDEHSTVPVSTATKIHKELDHAVMGEQMINKADQKLGRELVHGGWRGLIASWRLAWHEGRHTARTSLELLSLYRRVSADHPELAGRELYKLIVMERNDCDEVTANVILECVEKSFTTWPVSRELTLCDVVRYLTVKEFLALREGENWMHTDVRQVVVSRIPQELCIDRKKE